MTDLPSVSIIMSVTDRPRNLMNTLLSWDGINYPNYDFHIITNGETSPQTERILTEFVASCPVASWEKRPKTSINRQWNYGGKNSKGDFVVFAMMDEIISSKDILLEMVKCPRENRCSVNTYFLSERMTYALATIPWKENPKVIEELGGFWEEIFYQDFPNKLRTAAGIITHITGQMRENWEYFNWFRDDEEGHLWLDQDLHLREVCVNRGATTVENVVCYHQWHSPNMDITMRSGYSYHNEMQARLLEEAPHER